MNSAKLSELENLPIFLPFLNQLSLTIIEIRNFLLKFAKDNLEENLRSMERDMNIDPENFHNGFLDFISTIGSINCSIESFIKENEKFISPKFSPSSIILKDIKKYKGYMERIDKMILFIHGVCLNMEDIRLSSVILSIALVISNNVFDVIEIFRELLASSPLEYERIVRKLYIRFDKCRNSLINNIKELNGKELKIAKQCFKSLFRDNHDRILTDRYIEMFYQILYILEEINSNENNRDKLIKDYSELCKITVEIRILFYKRESLKESIKYLNIARERFEDNLGFTYQKNNHTKVSPMYSNMRNIL